MTDARELDNVPWHRLHHAYGPATDVPQLLRDIASRKPKVREEAWDRLNGNLWHQGTVYEAAAHAVPFLIELSQAPNVPERHVVLIYLGVLASGKSYLDVHQHMSLFEEERKRPDFTDRLEEELGWVRAAREAVRAGAPDYARLFADPAQQIRAGAAYLLGHFREDAERNIGWIRAHVDSNEADEVARQCHGCPVGLWPSRQAVGAAGVS